MAIPLNVVIVAKEKKTFYKQFLLIVEKLYYGLL